jgi:hypothetical protein
MIEDCRIFRISLKQYKSKTKMYGKIRCVDLTPLVPQGLGAVYLRMENQSDGIRAANIYSFILGVEGYPRRFFSIAGSLGLSVFDTETGFA